MDANQEKILREAVRKQLKSMLQEGAKDAWWSSYGTTFTVKNAYQKKNQDAFNQEEMKIQDVSMKMIKLIQKAFKGMDVDDIQITLKK